MTSLMHLPQKDTNTAYPTVAGLSNKYDVWKRWQTINRKPEKQSETFPLCHHTQQAEWESAVICL